MMSTAIHLNRNSLIMIALLNRNSSIRIALLNRNSSIRIALLNRNSSIRIALSFHSEYNGIMTRAIGDMMNRLLTILLSSVTTVLALSPAQRGPLPLHVAFHNDTNQVGDPGWIAKMSSRRDGGIGTRTLKQDKFILPVLLGRFSDVAGTFSKEQFQDHLFDSNSTGTMTQYYSEVSRNQFLLTGTVFGWYQATQAKFYYTGGQNGYGTFPTNSAGFVQSVVLASDVDVDFSQFDNDGPDGIPNSGDDDGYADAVIVVYPGAGPDWYPGNDNLWPYTSSLGSNEITTNDGSANGGLIKVNSYAVCPERSGSSTGEQAMRDIGVYVHEFGHILGLPDLYDREGSGSESSRGLGSWCLMAGGSWGGDSNHDETPAHPSAWCKYQMGWVHPIELTSDTSSVSATHFTKGGETYLIWEDPDGWSRYFLVENRQKSGFDIHLPTEGLAIYHIDENRRYGDIQWNGGSVNDDENHKLVDLEEADGNDDLDQNNNSGDAGDLFPGSTNNTAFTDNTSPSSRDYSNEPTGISIGNITPAGDSSITFDITVKPVTGYVISYDEQGTTGWGYGYANSQTTTGGVLFTITDKGKVYGLDFGSKQAGSTVSFKLYKGFSSVPMNEQFIIPNTFLAEAGWHSFLFAESVAVDTGDIIFAEQSVQNLSYALSYDPFGELSGNSYLKSSNGTYKEIDGDLNMRLRVIKDETPVAVTSAANNNIFTIFVQQLGGAVQLTVTTAESGTVSAELFSLNGRRVKELFRGSMKAGSHVLMLPIHTVAAGGYILKVGTPGKIHSQLVIMQ